LTGLFILKNIISSQDSETEEVKNTIHQLINYVEPSLKEILSGAIQAICDNQSVDLTSSTSICAGDCIFLIFKI
jgi:hypothetical protein